MTVIRCVYVYNWLADKNSCAGVIAGKHLVNIIVFVVVGVNSLSWARRPVRVGFTAVFWDPLYIEMHALLG